MPAVWPDPEDVRKTIKFGPVTGEEYEGELDVDVEGDPPAERDVRLNTVYANETKVGKCAVPPREKVDLGVPVDDSVGGVS